MSKLVLALSLAGFSAGMIANPALAASPDDDTAVVANALLAGDYVAAESRIAELRLTNNDDAAMLINLGSAYAGMGRRADAQLAFKAALNAPEQDLETADGSIRSSRAIAAEGLRFLGVNYAGR
ncbi:MAG: tetratricopeptide repeat protein [Sphingobium sp.]|nr:tetratricopeptide repeat protein [Sphingobium sp.]MCP5398994.1 tetratricopeptide repeat protein [Sphingomonas sp.]